MAKSEFLTCFYQHSIHVLTAPLFANTVGDRPSRGMYSRSFLLQPVVATLWEFCRLSLLVRFLWMNSSHAYIACGCKPWKCLSLAFFIKFSLLLRLPISMAIWQCSYVLVGFCFIDDHQTAQLLSIILEMLTFCIEHHTHHIKAYVIGKNLLRRTLVLLKSKFAFLALGKQNCSEVSSQE